MEKPVIAVRQNRDRKLGKQVKAFFKNITEQVKAVWRLLKFLDEGDWQ